MNKHVNHSRMLLCCWILAIQLLLPSCRSTSQPREPQFDPMPIVWEALSQKIQVLGEKKAGLSEWKALAETSDRIVSEARLVEILQNAPLSTEGKNQFLKNHAYHSLWHFGFECNFHALVAFDEEDESNLILRW